MQIKNKKSNLSLYKWTAIISLSIIACLYVGGEIRYNTLEKNYAECLKKWENNISLSCNNSNYFVYVAETDEINKNTPQRILNAENEVNCIYNIKDSVQGNFKVDCHHIREIVKQFGQDKILIAIIFQESGFNPLAKNINKNGSVDRGLFQLNSTYWTIKQGDINHSIGQAKLCKKQNGYDCWVAYSSGDYVKYLDEAETLLAKINN